MCSASESKIFPSIIVTRPSEKKTFPPLEMGISKKKTEINVTRNRCDSWLFVAREKFSQESWAANDSRKAFRVAISHVFMVGKAGIIPEGNELMEEAHFLGESWGKTSSPFSSTKLENFIAALRDCEI